jgi:HEAT repeat protein
MGSLLADKDYIISELESRFSGLSNPIAVPQDIQLAIDEIKQVNNYNDFNDILNKLLLNPNHKSHQYVARLLQTIASPTSVPYVKKVLESGFDYLDYTCSESGVIAKWFSWILASIGTDEAIALMKEYSMSDDEGIRDEMLYRLNKIKR